MRARVFVAAAGLSLAAACSSGRPGVIATTSSAVGMTTTSPTSTTSTTRPVTTTVGPSTTVASTAATTATSAATTTLATTVPVTGARCVPTGDTAEVRVDFPDRLSRLVGAAIRTGARPCVERIVIELAGRDGDEADRVALPGYAVGYTTRPVLDSPRGEPVEVLGDAVLLVRFGAWMGDIDGNGYAGPNDVRPTNVTHVRQLLLIENFESMATWAVGLDAAYPFTVFTLSSPPRLVVDLFVG